MTSILDLHGILRWAVLAAGVAGLAHVLLAFPRFTAGTPRLHRVLGAAFMGLVDLQLVLGIVILVGIPASRTSGLVHALLMAAAVALGHVLSVRSRRTAPPRQVFWAAATFVGPLALILAGLAALP